MIFDYHTDIRARYPHLTGGIIVAHGVRNGASTPDLLASYHAEQQATLARIGDTPLSQIESLAAWRAAFRTFGVDPTQIRSACEALLRRLTKQGDIPSINALVDIGNLISIRYALPVAMIDLHAMTGAITVRFADGTENFTNLGQEEIAHPTPAKSFSSTMQVWSLRGAGAGVKVTRAPPAKTQPICSSPSKRSTRAVAPTLKRRWSILLLCFNSTRMEYLNTLCSIWIKLSHTVKILNY